MFGYIIVSQYQTVLDNNDNNDSKRQKNRALFMRKKKKKTCIVCVSLDFLPGITNNGRDMSLINMFTSCLLDAT